MLTRNGRRLMRLSYFGENRAVRCELTDVRASQRANLAVVATEARYRQFSAKFSSSRLGGLGDSLRDM
jgi:hypothetical protein